MIFNGNLGKPVYGSGEFSQNKLHHLFLKTDELNNIDTFGRKNTIRNSSWRKFTYFFNSTKFLFKKFLFLQKFQYERLRTGTTTIKLHLSF